MNERSSSPDAGKRPARRKRIRRPFSPPEPIITAGKFTGAKLSELSDDELNQFLRGDAGHQTSPAMLSLLGLSPSCLDLSQYWFAKYELERRKPETNRKPAAALEISASDTEESIALKLVGYGYRAASRIYHPDHGGNAVIMRRLNAARDLVKKRLSK